MPNAICNPPTLLAGYRACKMKFVFFDSSVSEGVCLKRDRRPPFERTNSQFPIPNPQFPIPNAQLPIPNSQSSHIQTPMLYCCVFRTFSSCLCVAAHSITRNPKSQAPSAQSQFPLPEIPLPKALGAKSPFPIPKSQNSNVQLRMLILLSLLSVFTVSS